MDDTTVRLTFAIIIAMLSAGLLAMRSMITLEKRIGRIEEHIEKLVNKTLLEEYNIEKKIKKQK